jgi:sigma-E factor negative regulatory protein RseB
MGRSPLSTFLPAPPRRAVVWRILARVRPSVSSWGAGLLVAVPLVAAAQPPSEQAPGTSGAPAAVAPSAASAPALSAASAAANAANAQELHAWLLRIHDAASRANYIGTLVNWAGGTVTSTRVMHFADGRGEVEKVEALDGEARGALRVGDQVRTVWPLRHLAVVEPRDPRAAFPALVTGGDLHIPEFYELRLLASQRIAGHDADRLLLKARDTVRFDQLLWIDRASGLLLREDVQASGRTLESSAFSEVSIGMRPQPEIVFDDMRRSNAFHLVPTTLERTQLEAEGWRLKGPLPAGFQVLACVRRMMPTTSAGATVASGVRVLQAIFTDGLTHVSVFVEPYQPQRHQGAGLSVIGATHTMMRRVNDDWLTGVGDVPPTTLEQFLLVLERRR